MGSAPKPPKMPKPPEEPKPEDVDRDPRDRGISSTVGAGLEKLRTVSPEERLKRLLGIQ